MRAAGLFFLVLPILLGGCESKNSQDRAKWSQDIFIDKFKDLSEIAQLKQITDTQRDILPFFSESGHRIYFTRYLIINPNDSSEEKRMTESRDFSYDYRNNKLYMIDADPESTQLRTIPPPNNWLPPDSLPSSLIETPLSGFRTPHGIYFCASRGQTNLNTNIFRLIGDSLIQVTYGNEPSFLEAVTADGRYLAFTYGKENYRTVVLDIPSGEFYGIPRGKTDIQIYELAPRFSPDSRYMVFVVSNNVFNIGGVPLGDVWLAEFKER